MSRITAEAARQIEDLFDFYLLVTDRPDAARRLRADLATARQLIEANPKGGASHPRPYPSLAPLGFRWIKVRVYWVGWGMMGGEPIITNVLHESADLEGRSAASTDDPKEW